MSTPVLACLLASFVASVCKAISGFGEAIVFIVILRAVSSVNGSPFEPKETIALLVPMAMASNVYLTATGWADVDWWLVRRAAAPMLVCGIVGTQLLVRLKAELVQRALGLLFLSFVGMRGTQAYAARARRLLERTASVSSPGSALPIADVDNDPPAVSGAHDDLDDESLQEGDLNVSRVSADGRTRVQALAAVLAGALSGLFGGWFAVAGPPFMIYFTQFHASKGAMRASFIFHALLLNVPTMPALIHAGLVNGELWPQYAAQLIGLTSGGLLGLWLHAKVSAHAVMAGVLGLLFASSAVMLSAGDHAGALRIATACALAAGLAVSAGEA